ncbi:putative s-adenosyl-l-methionine-dependent methyltransferase protein [Botrytis fragariae]|uniref:Putative s-adenosyl-l-methionine-dependent methyltransferase protein n=1 Tax=Botrytis fragariae TaxID=1964551 RepID=A0A8H6AKQ5_9HELO|nr:putative s-adenosyl-l-methionine-dependent methyltransferase protein [Botrytis fragariae]KAF5869060.1 putative s-adenosyl-l-methionine-dependent methyltransferase protein [Botrytis fragariae]
MAFLLGIEFRRRFAQLFKINPSLTNNEAYDILEANLFDIPKTCLEIAKKTQESIQEREFWIPKRALEQLEVSERPEKKIRSSQTPEQSRPNIIINKNLPDQEAHDSNNQQVKSKEIIEIYDSDDETRQEIVVDDERSIVQNDADPCSFDQAVTGSKREFSDIEILDEWDIDSVNSGNESDSETDYGSHQSRSTFDLHMKSVEKLKASESTEPTKSAESIKPIRSETLATPLVLEKAGTLFHRTLRPVRIDDEQTLTGSGSKEYYEEIVSAHNSAEKFLHESRDNLIEFQAECRAGDSVLVQDDKYPSLFA